MNDSERLKEHVDGLVALTGIAISAGYIGNVSFGGAHDDRSWGLFKVGSDGKAAMIGCVQTLGELLEILDDDGCRTQIGEWAMDPEALGTKRLGIRSEALKRTMAAMGTIGPGAKLQLLSRHRRGVHLIRREVENCFPVGSISRALIPITEDCTGCGPAVDVIHWLWRGYYDGLSGSDDRARLLREGWEAKEMQSIIKIGNYIQKGMPRVLAAADRAAAERGLWEVAGREEEVAGREEELADQYLIGYAQGRRYPQ